MRRLSEDEICMIMDALRDSKNALEEEYERDIKRGKLQGSIMDNIKADGLDTYYSDIENLYELFRLELIERDY